MTDMELLRQQKAICRLAELVDEHASIGAQMRVLSSRRIDIDKDAAGVLENYFPRFTEVTAGRDSVDKADKLIKIYKELLPH